MSYEYLRSFLEWKVDHDIVKNEKIFSTGIRINSRQAVSGKLLAGPDGVEIEKMTKEKIVEDIARMMYELLEIDHEDRAKLDFVKDIPFDTLCMIVSNYKFHEIDDRYRRMLQEKRNGQC